MGYQKNGRVIEQVTSIATAGGTTTLTNTSPQNTRFTGTSDQNLKLPDATTCPNGTIFRSKNDSTGTITIQYNDASTLKTISPDTSKELVLFDNSTSNGVWGVFEGSGTGTGSGINYILNPDAEFSTVGWSTYADAAGTSPVNGTGGSPTVTWSRSTTTPLRKTADFNFVKSASNLQGEGVSYDFTIDSADKAKSLNISFDYEIVSGTYADTDMSVWIYDVTNAVVIQPNGYSIANSVGVPGKQVCSFQASSNSTSYRLILHVGSTSASAYTLAFDNFNVGPTVVVNGTPVTDWNTNLSFTPNSFGTISDALWYSRRVGDTLEVNGYFRAGTVAASDAYMDMPAGYLIDTNKVNNSGEKTFLGTYIGLDDSAGTTFGSNNKIGAMFMVQGQPQYVYFANRSLSGQPGEFAIDNASTLFSDGYGVTMNFRLPILGWSSNVQMSADVGAANVQFKASQAVFNILSATEITINPNVTEFDTVGGYNQSTGEFTLPTSDVYSVTGMLYNGGTLTANVGSIELYIELDGTKKAYVVNSIGTSTADGATISTLIKGNAGQKIRLRGYQGGPAAEDFIAEFTIQKASKTSLVGVNEVVAAIADSSATTLTSGGNTIVPTNITKNTHGSLVGGTFTAPVAGPYQVNMYLQGSSVSYTAGDVLSAYVEANAVVVPLGVVRVQSTGTHNLVTSGSQTVYVEAGQTIVFKGQSSTSTSIGAFQGSIIKVG